jgi:hypothetical protein
MPSRSGAAVSRREQWLERFVFAVARLALGPSGHGRARGILRIFHLAERLEDHRRWVRPLRPGGMLGYEIGPLPGRGFPLPGQPDVRHGERVVIIHFDNRTILSHAATVASTEELAWKMSRIAIKDLTALAVMARDGALPDDVRAAWAETIRYRSMARFGFTTRPAPYSWRSAFIRVFQLGLLWIYSRDESAQLDESHRRLRLGENWIGLDALQRRYLGGQADRAAAPIAAHAAHTPGEDAAQDRAAGGTTQ